MTGARARRVWWFMAAAAAIIWTSCTTVRDYPARTPFVYQSSVEIGGKYTTDERKTLTAQLTQQLHDSISVRKAQKFIFWQSLRNPPVYDSLNADKSVLFMRALLTSLGYTRDTITYDTTIKVVKGDQYRTSVQFRVIPGRLVTLDSISYNLRGDTVIQRDTFQIYPGSDTLQRLTREASGATLLKKGAPFSRPLISSEFDRLADLYRNNGYLLFSREELVGVWDTVDRSLLRPTIDPFEQAALLEALAARRANPTADIEIRLRSNPDTSHLIRYYVGNVTVYPDLSADTTQYLPIIDSAGGYRFISYRNLFRPETLSDYIFLRRGELYRQSNFLRTQNRFNALGAFRLVNIDQIPRAGTDTVDFVIRLSPAAKYFASANLETSRNNNILTTGSLIGLGINLSLQNRNFARGANQARTSIRFGTELNAARNQPLVQTQQVNISHNIIFPRIVPALRWVPERIRENTRTVFSMNVGNIDRRQLFNLTTVNTSWGYEFSWKNKLLAVRLPNIEYNFLNRGPDLDSLINRISSYRYIFNTGLISSIIANYTIAGGGRNLTTLSRFNVEGSGLLSGMINSPFINKNLYRFIKLDAEYRRTRTIRRTALAGRAFAGVGYGLESARNPNNRYLPFYRQYFGGGPNSMRAWGVRRLGPGSVVRSYAQDQQPDRFGDIQLEVNGEYRFFLYDFSGIILNSALFTDVGNVWYLRDDPTLEGEQFRLNKLWKDLAIGVGTGLRVDFGFLKLRLDYAYKAKDPSPDIVDAAGQNKWFYDFRAFKGRLQLGIDYPF